jgi:hypothetical protein
MAGYDEKRTTTLSKEELGAFRNGALLPYMKTVDFKRLEKKYGKYLFVPLDIPRIEPNDKAKFKEWFISNAQPIFKRKPDIANPDQTAPYELPSFLSIDSKEIDSVRVGKVWDTNPVSNLYEEFPEIYDGLKELPFKDIQHYSLWSSLWRVSPHRDAAPLCDLPFAFRIKLYDENPIETLSLHRGLPDIKLSALDKFRIKAPAESNAFVWNNFRTLHSSRRAPSWMKVLMIVAAPLSNGIDMVKYEALIERSIQKFESSCWIDSSTIDDYIDDQPA